MLSTILQSVVLRDWILLPHSKAQVFDDYAIDIIFELEHNWDNFGYIDCIAKSNYMSLLRFTGLHTRIIYLRIIMNTFHLFALNTIYAFIWELWIGVFYSITRILVLGLFYTLGSNWMTLKQILPLCYRIK